MVKRSKLTVIKIPNQNNFEFKTPSFNIPETLYLELLHNPIKVRQDIRNLPYIPDDNSNKVSYNDERSVVDEEINKELADPEFEGNDLYKKRGRKPRIQQPTLNLTLGEANSRIVKEDYNNQVENYQESLRDKLDNLRNSRQNSRQGSTQNSRQNSRQNSSQNIRKDYSYDIEDNKNRNDDDDEIILNDKRDDLYAPKPVSKDKIYKNDWEISKDRDISINISSSNNEKYDDDYDNDSSSKYKEKSRYSDEDDDNDIRKMLSGKKENQGQETKYINEERRTNSNQLQNQNQGQNYIPPTLEEITQGKAIGGIGSGGITNLSYSSQNDEKELEKKRDLLFKFSILKKKYKGAYIPEFTEHTDLQTLEREFNQLVRQLNIDSKVHDYKKYMTYGFIGLEFMLINFLEWKDMEGLTAHQITKLNEYDKLLIEIGEKHSADKDSSFSPEVRLAFSVFMNTLMFVAARTIGKKIGDSDVLSNMLGIPKQSTTNNTSSTTNDEVKKKKMSGPSINADDLFDKKYN